jgi:hypothetical protein
MHLIFSKADANSPTFRDRKMMKKKNGKRYGVLNIGAPYALLSGKWMKDKCGTEATPVVTSGRVDRIVAFMRGQLDATSVQCSGRIALNAERPNEFPILRKFAKEIRV